MISDKIFDFKKNWRLRWLGLIFEFSHIEYQKGLWFDLKYPDKVGSFNEDICQYFDDLDLSDNYESQLLQGIISAQEYLTIKDFHFGLDSFVKSTNKLGDKFVENSILENNEWINLCDLAKIKYFELKKLIYDQSEKEFLKHLEQNYLT